MLKINNLRKVFALIGAGITISSFSGCTKNKIKNTDIENSKTSITVSEETKEVVDNELYWWPIGSKETFEENGEIYASKMPEESKIVKKFMARKDLLSKQDIKQSHEGLDIATQNKEGKTNIIASKSGIVVYPSKSDRIDYTNNDKESSSYGNYVIIEHVDGNYTLYAHLKENTITVKAGDVVKQGQIIGKLGDSGNAIGANLHFEIRYGGNTINRSVNPENYVNKDYPRLTNGKKNFTSDDIEYKSIKMH